MSGKFYMHFGEYERNIGEQYSSANEMSQNLELFRSDFGRLEGEGLWDDAHNREATGGIIHHANQVDEVFQTATYHANKSDQSLGEGEHLSQRTGVAVNALMDL
ncbi:hypothetical protein EV646_112287 [Kribbella antiqua]|uniref:Uncharacterized protein n=1 Tax=Kribbella antiqua TaxID=2512217 RepID=A0A4R2IIR8_9ACTN|nr:hypothetical protein [Kribbella antiqua]TCO43709.1 hypothetical protein EV646_112287 [Kribbella antiqua]